VLLYDLSGFAHRLHRFFAWCADSRLPELERLAGTIEAW
jgi:hypothetical protein